ncbi:hypothetical protein [Caulobacter hibisci]|uniref:Uncharacterized protein n=1 Tax=Caulobacter hibisci TaxID=2035993 RepID=A0ABS0SRZ6_9CAUL|nr:hypothetical protein [Caulobacter hibisci]MBI1682377.1 hypothetical protein [Caulobacter hibisci]
MTQTMRERLIRSVGRATGWGIGPGAVILTTKQADDIVDGILAELRDGDKPMILAGLDSFKLAMAEEPRPGILADAFTAMIDAVRKGK